MINKYLLSILFSICIFFSAQAHTPSDRVNDYEIYESRFLVLLDVLKVPERDEFVLLVADIYDNLYCYYVPDYHIPFLLEYFAIEYEPEPMEYAQSWFPDFDINENNYYFTPRWLSPSTWSNR